MGFHGFSMGFPWDLPNTKNMNDAEDSTVNHSQKTKK